jgi:hypothetical protein
MKLSDLKLHRFTLLQTAQSGHGKTTRTLTATRFGKLYIFDLDGKAQGAARNLPIAMKIDSDLVEVDSFDSLDAALVKLKELVAMGKDIPYATVCVDTFTALNEMAYIKFMGSNLEKGIKADYDIWGKIDSFLLNFFNLLFSLPCNIIVNAHVAESEDEVTKRTKYAQAGRGGFRTKLPNRFTDSHYLVFQFDKYQVRVKNSDTLPVNTSIDPKLISKDGMATVNDLSIFDAYAIKKL